MSSVEITTFRNMVQRHSVTEFRYKCCMAKDYTVGDRIRTRRKEIGMPVAVLAKAASIAPTTLYDLERGDSVSSTALPLIAATLGLHGRWLADKTGPRLTGDPAIQGQNARMPVHGVPITAEEAEVGREWGKLEEPARSTILMQIQLMVAAEKRGELSMAKGSASKKRRKDKDESRSSQ